MNYLLERLREPSTWRGLVWVLAAAGVVLDPTQVQAITTAGMAVAGLVGVLAPDEKEKSL